MHSLVRGRQEENDNYRNYHRGQLYCVFASVLTTLYLAISQVQNSHLSLHSESVLTLRVGKSQNKEVRKLEASR